MITGALGLPPPPCAGTEKLRHEPVAFSFAGCAPSLNGRVQMPATDPEMSTLSPVTMGKPMAGIVKS